MAYEFNGTNQSLQTASTPVNSPSFSIACWFNPSNIVSRVMISICGTSAQTTNSRYFLGIRATGAVSAASLDSNSNIAAANTISPALNVWQHVCGVFTTNSFRSVYLDGGNRVDDTTLINPTTSDIKAIYVGCQLIGSPQSFFNGRIAEVGIWNAALTASEIAGLAKGMTCDKIRPQSLVFYAPLVRNLMDAKGGLTITNNNSATIATHPRVYA